MMLKMSGVILPEESKFLRQAPASKKDDPEFLAAFDRRKLFYDVFFDSESAEVVLVAPKLRTQTAFFRSMIIKIDGHIIKDVQIEQLSARTNQIRIKSPVPAPSTMRIIHRTPPKLNVQVPINPADTDRFKGKNALVAISKNNKLTWIKDWLHYYVHQHHANAVVLIDNASDAYAIPDLEKAIASVEGIEAFALLSAPYPFGPKGVDRTSVNAKFLHLSALHIAHRRLLRHANAVLSVDIDELVTKPGKRTVFEAVKDTKSGFLSIRGSWRYAIASSNDTREVRHADHSFKRIAKDAHMQPKWCIDPTGPLAGRYWRTHGIANATRYFAHEFAYLHCRQITTNWDYNRDFEARDLFEKAPEAADLMRVFGQESFGS